MSTNKGCPKRNFLAVVLNQALGVDLAVAENMWTQVKSNTESFEVKLSLLSKLLYNKLMGGFFGHPRLSFSKGLSFKVTSKFGLLCPFKRQFHKMVKHT